MEQIGFCKNKRTSDHLFVLKTLIDRSTQQGYNRPAVENQKIKCNELMGYTPISYIIGKRNDGDSQNNDAVKVGSGHVFA